jgi:hypothetical protein
MPVTTSAPGKPGNPLQAFYESADVPLSPVPTGLVGKPGC